MVLLTPHLLKLVLPWPLEAPLSHLTPHSPAPSSWLASSSAHSLYWHFGLDRLWLWRAVTCIVEGLIASLASIPPPTCDKQKCLQMSPTVPWWAKSSLVENHCPKWWCSQNSFLGTPHSHAVPVGLIHSCCLNCHLQGDHDAHISFSQHLFFFWVLGSEGLVQPGPPIWIPEDRINFSTFTDTQENSPPPQPPVFAVLKKGITNHPIQSHQPWCHHWLSLTVHVYSHEIFPSHFPGLGFLEIKPLPGIENILWVPDARCFRFQRVLHTQALPPSWQLHPATLSHGNVVCSPKLALPAGAEVLSSMLPSLFSQMTHECMGMCALSELMPLAV